MEDVYISRGNIYNTIWRMYGVTVLLLDTVNHTYTTQNKTAMEGYIDRGTYYELEAPSNTPEWEKAREGKVTATGVSSLLGKNRFQSRVQYKSQVINGTKIEMNEDMRRGRDNEAVALELYCKERNCKVRKPSFCVSKDMTGTGATPDAIILNDDGTDSTILVEVKNPREIKKFIYENYQYQMLFQMATVGATACDYVQHCNGAIYTIRYLWDEVVWEFIEPEIHSFVAELK